MINEICILSSTGDCIVAKHYGVKRSNWCLLNTLRRQLNDDSAADLPPYYTVDGTHCVHIKRQGLYFAAAAPQHSTPVCVIDLLKQFHLLVKNFCGTATEVAVRANVVLVMEILDEFIDSGYIQQSLTSKLKPYIQSQAVLPSAAIGPVSTPFGIEYRMAPSVTADFPVFQSRGDQVQRTNELFIDVVERLNVSISADGLVERCEVRGEIKMKSLAVGSPVVKVKLSEDLNICSAADRLSGNVTQTAGYGTISSLQDITVHESAELEKLNTLSIQPPEGQFTLMSYQLNGALQTKLPFRIHSFIKDMGITTRDLEVSLSLHCELPAHGQAVNVILRLPVPPSTISMAQQLSGNCRGQKALYSLTSKIIEWKLPEVRSAAEASAHFKLIGARSSEHSCRAVGPVMVEFEVSGYVCSSLLVRSVLVNGPSTSNVPMKWLRYITIADSYVVKVI